LLTRRQIVIENDQVRAAPLHPGCNFVNFAFARKCRRIRPETPPFDDLQHPYTRAFGKSRNFFHALVEIRVAQVKAYNHCAITGVWSFEHQETGLLAERKGVPETTGIGARALIATSKAASGALLRERFQSSDP
jgi:hypothetical protein